MSIHVPGQPRSNPVNPLEVLAVALDKTNQHLRSISTSTSRIAVNTAKEERHIYALTPRPDGDWASYCLACSEAVESWVYPCKINLDDVAPPSHIAVLPDTLGLPQ